MEKEKLEQLVKKLEDEKSDIIKTLRSIEENEYNDSLQTYTSELSLYDNHPADVGSETFEMEKTYALKGQQLHRLQEIEQALDKIEKGDYGKCSICGKEIKLERLEAYPEADTCIECSKSTRIPQDRLMQGRPVEEEVLNYPYNREFGSEEDQTGFDGEDSWQAVARYNRREDPSNQTGDQQGVWDEELSGYVEDVEKISNKYYKGQLPDEEREDIEE